mgnify:CR=1 FL=1
MWLSSGDVVEVVVGDAEGFGGLSQGVLHNGLILDVVGQQVMHPVDFGHQWWQFFVLV